MKWRNYKIFKLALLIFLFTVSVLAQEKRAVVFRNVTLIDMRIEQPQQNMTVVVEANRIAKIGRNVKIPKNAEVIDASGKFLIPGLWDMHSHFLFEGLKEPFMKLFIPNGVTGVRDLGGELLEQLSQIRQSITEGKILGPRIVAAGPIVDGPKPVWKFSIPVSNAEEGRKVVRTLKEKGADFVKIYSLLSRDSYFAIADEANKQKIPFAGHIPNAVTAVEASGAGQKSIEHIFIYLDVSSDEKELRRERSEAEAKGQSEFNKVRAAQTSRILNTFSEEKVKLLAERFARNGTWFVPTLTLHRSLAFLNDSSFAEDSRLKYIPKAIKSYWKMQREQMPEEVIKRNRLYYTKDLQIVGLMNRGGAKLLAGSDMGNPYVYPGFSLHDELALLVEAGLTPLEALRTTTVNPAKFFGKEKEFGTIEKGKLADLVLLDANPLADISNTRKINAVVVNGRLLKRADLDEMLNNVAESAKE